MVLDFLLLGIKQHTNFPKQINVHVTYFQTKRTGPFVIIIIFLSPSMSPMHMTTFYINKRLFIETRASMRLTGENQRSQTNRTLWTAGIDSFNQVIELLFILRITKRHSMVIKKYLILWQIQKYYSSAI